ncbi:ferredoxin [Nocardioides sp. NPDC006273]|uniref:ferredoxin n=1 Tax=Nocardioides sp. NPDC006273 TaxID=3155598 RepID=UPI0033BFB5A2
MSAATTVELDQGRCRGYGICVSILPDVFDLPADSKVAVLLRDEVDADDVDDLEESVRACPAQAIIQGARSI